MNSIFSINRNRGEYLSKLLARIGCLLLFAAMLFGVSTSQAQTVSTDFSNRNGSTPAVPSDLFGSNGAGVNVTGNAVSQLTNAGLTGTRIWISITDIYKTATPNFNGVDMYLKSVSSSGLHPIAVMYQTPSSLGSSRCSMPSDVSQWSQMAASVVAHFNQTYPGLVQDYEIWNEPDSNVSLCVPASQALNDYLSIYAAAAPAMKAQAEADGQTIRVGGPVITTMSAVPTWIPALLSGATAPYVDFVSFHIYPTGQQDINNGMTWDGLYKSTQSIVPSFYAKVESLVRKGSQPHAATTPIYVSELNSNWAFAVDGLRNDPTYGPLWNSVAITDLLNMVYNGAKAGPSRIDYYAANASGKYFCLLGEWDANMDCNAARTDPYPQYYAYQLFAAPNFLNLQAGGNMAASVSTGTTQNGLLATAFYTEAADNVVIVNPTSTDFNAVPVTLLNTGLTSVTGTSYLLNSSNGQISTGSVALSPTSGGYTGTVAVPAYSTVAVSLTGSTAPAPVATTAVLNVTPTSGTAPLVVSIDSSASQGIVGRTISFGDGTWLNGTPTTTHTYTKAGSYTVQLTVKDASGQTKTASRVVTVTAAAVAPVPVLNVTPISGTAPLVVTIDSSASQGGGSSTITGRTINFGDGTPVISTATTTHTYTNPGTYTVNLTLTNQAGLTATASSVVTVTAPPPPPAPAAVAPVPVLNVTPTSGTAPLVVSIDSSASQGIVGRTISFGDGTWLNGTPTTTHTYTKAGSYTVQLTVKNQAGLTATASSVVTVN